MEITFKCSSCDQELAVEDVAAGTEIECPTCGTHLLVPEPEPEGSEAASQPEPEPEPEPPAEVGHAPSVSVAVNAIADSAAAKDRHHFSVPTHEGPSEILIRKANKPLEVAAKESDRKIRCKCIRRIDCMEVGKDHFDEHVTDFLCRVGENNVISVTSITYTHIDIGSQKILTDYGVMIIFRG